jgi:hypothetical protein
MLMNILAGLSLILAFATGGLWAWSYWRFYSLSYYRPSTSDVHTNTLACGSGIVVLSHQVLTATTRDSNVLSLRLAGWRTTRTSPRPELVSRALSTAHAVGFERAGLGWQHSQRNWNRGTTSDERTLLLPCWLLVLAFAVLPAARCRSELRRRRRAKIGHCPQCGYDLRATPEKGGALLDRCPECGHEMLTPQTPLAIR